MREEILKEKINEFSISSIKEEVRKASERSKTKQNAKVIGNSTVVFYYRESEKTTIRENKRMNAFLQKL
jgi:hypothetical protein